MRFHRVGGAAGAAIGVLAGSLAFAAVIGTSGCGLLGATNSGGSSIGGSSSGQPAPSPQLSASSTTVSFGNVTVGTPAQRLVVVTDAGTANVTISGVSTTGTGFTASNESNVTLTPNQSVTISVSFDPTNAGAIQGSLSVTSNATNSPLGIPLSGSGIAAASQLSSSSTSLSFGNVTVGTPTPEMVTLTDLGTANVDISAVSVTGTGFRSSGGVNAALTPNGTTTVSVTFNPTGTGAVQGVLSITSNATNSVLNIPLSGTGVAKTTQSSQLSSSSSSVSFGNVTVGTPTGQTVTLMDVGNANITISAVSATGGGFSATGGLNVTLTPNQSVTIAVSFDPTSPGAVQGNLSISSNATNSLVQLGLSGTGVAQAVAHSVALNWQPSTSVVIGYYVYRGAAANSLSKLTGSVDSATNYTDTSVADGQTYYYAVTSVDSSNVESVQSNQVSVTIPAN